MHHPETGYDEDEDEQSPVGDDAQKTATNVGHAFAFAGCLGRFVKQYNGQQGDECHGAGKVIDVNVGLVANLITQGVDNGFACKGSDVHHHVKNGVTACTGSFGGFFGNGSRYDGLDEGTANHQRDQHRHNNPAFAALRQTVKLCGAAVGYQSG